MDRGLKGWTAASSDLEISTANVHCSCCLSALSYFPSGAGPFGAPGAPRPPSNTPPSRAVRLEQPTTRRALPGVARHAEQGSSAPRWNRHGGSTPRTTLTSAGVLHRSARSFRRDEQLSTGVARAANIAARGRRAFMDRGPAPHPGQPCHTLPPMPHRKACFLLPWGPPLRGGRNPRLLSPSSCPFRPRPQDCEALVAEATGQALEAFLKQSQTTGPCTAVWVAGTVAYRCGGTELLSSCPSCLSPPRPGRVVRFTGRRAQGRRKKHPWGPGQPPHAPGLPAGAGGGRGAQGAEGRHPGCPALSTPRHTL